MFIVKQVKRAQYASWKVVQDILITYGDADRQAEHLSKLQLEGWRIVKAANGEKDGLEIMNTVSQLVPENHVDTTGGAPDLAGLTREELLAAIEGMTENVTPETIVELGKALNNGVTLANKTPLRAKPKRGGEKIDFSAMTSRFMEENPVGSDEFVKFMAAMSGGKLEEFLTQWASSKVAAVSPVATPVTGGSTLEEILAAK